jgi:hypothetical protein
MSRHVAVVLIQCMRCGALAQRTYVAHSGANGLRLSSSLSCASCSLAEESDGPELTEDARRAFYASEGRWSAQVSDLGPRRADALHVLRLFRRATPTEIISMVNQGTSILDGALVEVEQVEEMLKQIGGKVILARLTD